MPLQSVSKRLIQPRRRHGPPRSRLPNIARCPGRTVAGSPPRSRSHPAGATMETFDWRVSIADVERDGPFSRFPGVDRTIVVIDGAGMRFNAAGAATRDLRTPFEPYAFDGDEAIDCTLVAGPSAISTRCVGAVARGRVWPSCAAPKRRSRRRLLRHLRGDRGARVCGVRTARRRSSRPATRWSSSALTNREAAPIAVRPLAGDAVALAVRIECP